MPHRSVKTFLALGAATLCVVFALAGCQRKGIEDLLGDDLFTISLGKLEDQIDLFQFEGAMTEKTNSVYMRDGWFYVANGNAGKIMVFSSYGDLLFLLYNPQTNPAPTTLGPVDPAATTDAATRGAVAYPFTDIGQIAVASDRTLYVEDAIAAAKEVKDPALGMVLTRVVLRFDRKGRPLGYLGQEGIGGTPFPYIYSLSVTAQDQLVVVCRLPDYSWVVYWFSRDAALLYKDGDRQDHLPVPAAKGAVPTLINIFPDLQSPILYLAIIHVHECRHRRHERPGGREGRARTSSTCAPGSTAALPSSFPRTLPARSRQDLKTTEIPSPPSDLLGLSTNGLYLPPRLHGHEPLHAPDARRLGPAEGCPPRCHGGFRAHLPGRPSLSYRHHLRAVRRPHEGAHLVVAVGSPARRGASREGRELGVDGGDRPPLAGRVRFPVDAPHGRRRA